MRRIAFIMSGVSWLLIVSLASATEISPGPVSGDWYASGNPYNINGEINVPSDSLLTIHEGVEVIFQGHYKFIVNSNGSLQALGTEQDSILFTAQNAATGWHGIRFLGASSTSRLQYCHLKYGNATGSLEDQKGGAIYCSNSGPTILHCTIEDCHAAYNGGGINCGDNSNATISDNAIRHNSATNGGAITCHHSNPTISGNSIDDNTANSNGGGIDLWDHSNPYITGNVISGNSCGLHGGGICCQNSSSPAIEYNEITENEVTGSGGLGGGIYCSGSSPSIRSNDISHNTATYNGGGINCVSGSHPLVEYNSIRFNSATNGGGITCHQSHPNIRGNYICDNAAATNGGGIDLWDNADPHILNNTISRNSAGTQGGGICIQQYSDPVIVNSIIWGNTPASSSQVFVASNASVAVTYSDVQGGCSGTGNIAEDPLFVDAVGGDYHLQAGSPCIDAGTTEDAAPYDIDSDARPFGEGIDMGADEASPPTADAGPDQVVYEGEIVILDGSASSDPEDQPLTYNWVQLAGPEVSLDLTDPVHPTFTAPWVPLGGETVTFELTVNDGGFDSDPDAVNISVVNVNHPPVSDAGEDQTVNEGTEVTLDGSESYDPDGEEITYDWSQVSGTSVVLSDPADSMPTFTAPAVGPEGEWLAFELTVCDLVPQCTSDIVEILIENANHPPVADAGDPQTSDEGSTVSLDGTSSSDPDGDLLSYNWVQVSGPEVCLSDSLSPMPTFTAPLVDPGGASILFTLTVNDGEWLSDPDSVVITVLNMNDPPSCELALADVDRLWPPNHKMVDVNIIGVADPDDDEVVVTVTGVTQDEPTNGLGDGDTSPDAVIQGSGQVLLRAERAGGWNGRVYTIYFEALDSFGQSCSGSVTVGVPHDRRDNTIIDDGQIYDSLQP